MPVDQRVNCQPAEFPDLRPTAGRDGEFMALLAAKRIGGGIAATSGRYCWVLCLNGMAYEVAKRRAPSAEFR